MLPELALAFVTYIPWYEHEKRYNDIFEPIEVCESREVVLAYVDRVVRTEEPTDDLLTDCLLYDIEPRSEPVVYVFSGKVYEIQGLFVSTRVVAIYEYESLHVEVVHIHSDYISGYTIGMVTKTPDPS